MNTLLFIIAVWGQCFVYDVSQLSGLSLAGKEPSWNRSTDGPGSCARATNCQIDVSADTAC